MLNKGFYDILNTLKFIFRCGESNFQTKLVTSDCLEISVLPNDINILGIQKRITGTLFHTHDIKYMTVSFIILNILSFI